MNTPEFVVAMITFAVPLYASVLRRLLTSPRHVAKAQEVLGAVKPNSIEAKAIKAHIARMAMTISNSDIWRKVWLFTSLGWVAGAAALFMGMQSFYTSDPKVDDIWTVGAVTSLGIAVVLLAAGVVTVIQGWCETRKYKGASGGS